MQETDIKKGDLYGYPYYYSKVNSKGIKTYKPKKVLYISDVSELCFKIKPFINCKYDSGRLKKEDFTENGVFRIFCNHTYYNNQDTIQNHYWSFYGKDDDTDQELLYLGNIPRYKRIL